MAPHGPSRPNRLAWPPGKAPHVLGYQPKASEHDPYTRIPPSPKGSLRTLHSLFGSGAAYRTGRARSALRPPINTSCAPKHQVPTSRSSYRANPLLDTFRPEKSGEALRLPTAVMAAAQHAPNDQVEH
ncbi:hypothetical protein Taro_043552 [Colocasia esculenta]|uniref:Uncharacterized protein n=1 Tax=Colocasia esculenta TaxID=4460 RepID=A0A843WGR1_COLES|nr:hypothetical protein [Colocasia esculenta]